MSIRVRSSSMVRFIGAETKELHGSKLPLTKDVMRYFFYQKRSLKKTIRESARVTVKEAVSKFWSRTEIPRVQDIRGIEKIEKLFYEWQGLNKSISREQKEEVDVFKQKMECLFDLSLKDAIPKMRLLITQERANPIKQAALEEDIQFLEDQQSDRQATIAGVDGKLAKVVKKHDQRQERKLEREKELEQRKKRGQDDSGARECTMEEHKDEVCGEGTVERENRDEIFPAPRSCEKGAGKINVVTSDVAQALDASKVSVNQATVILAATAKSLGINIEDTNINRSTVHKRRQRIREETASKIREEFCPDENEVLTLHWDGKIVPTLTGSDTVDRQAIVVTNKNTTQLLGAPALDHGTGLAIAQCVSEHVKVWNLVRQIKSMCFDTTLVNSGWRNGAAVWIERLLSKPLLWLPCRHHVLEIVLQAVFHAVMGPSKGPEPDVFKKLQSKWKDIDKASVNIPQDYPSILDGPRREELIALCQRQIDVGQPRDDYLELLELAIIFLGGVPSRGVRFQPPGPIHSARWMAKALYALKMSLFASQITLTEEERVGLLDVSFFVVSVYVEAWFAAPFSASAPRSDLQLAANIQMFASVHPAAAAAAQTKLCAHLWYLSEESVGLAVFDEGLPDSEREKIIMSIRNKQGEEEPPKKLAISFPELLSMQSSDLATVNTMSFFKTLDLSTEFFDIPVDMWHTSESYRRGKKVVDSLSVINDHAERVVKLFQDFNRTVTKQEQGFQNLLVNVAEHRKTLPNYQKRTIVKKYSL